MSRAAALVLLLTAGAAAQPPHPRGEGHPAEPPAQGADPDPTFPAEALRHVEDDAPVRHAGLNHEEALAYDRLFLHARRMPLDVLRRAARRDLTFAHLFGAGREAYRGQLVHLEGRLKLLWRFDPPESLIDAADPVPDLFEGWIATEESGGPLYCVVVSELPAGLAPAPKLDVPVVCDAYYFKRYRYGTREREEGQQVQRLAPLLIGRTIRPTNASAAASTTYLEVPGTVLAGVVAVAAATAAVGWAVVWWFRREDRRVRERLRRARPEITDPGDLGTEVAGRPLPGDPSVN